MLTAIVTIVGGLATIAGAVYGIFKYVAWKLEKTPAQTDAEIDAQIAADKRKAEETGRPV